MTENATGYVLTRSLMEWFWSRNAEPHDRFDPRASPLLADSLADLPPTSVFTAQFDPLRDEGVAYADALRAPGVPVEHVACRGQLHTRSTAVDVIISADRHRERMAAANRRFVG